MPLTIGELKEFIADLPDAAEVFIECLMKGEDVYLVETADITYSDNMDGRYLTLTPTEFGVEDGDDE